MTLMTARQIAKMNDISLIAREVGLGTRIDALEKLTVSGTPVNAVNSTKVLTVSGVVKDGETVTINDPLVTGTDVYEFLADTEQTKTSPTNIAVSIVANTTKASGTMTIATQPTSGDTMTIGTKVYTFVPAGTANADGEISIGTDLATAKAAILAAINGTDDHNDPHPLVTAGTFTVNNSTITALVGGTAGNSIATTETFTATGNVFGAATLGSGADCSAANGITALVAAITASDTQGVGAADGAGDTVDFTADIAGARGNNIEIAETMANGAFAGGATKLSGGVDGTVAEMGVTYIDSTYLYRCVADNTTAGKNWRRISLGSAY